MKDVWKDTSIFISLIAAVLTLWEKITPLFTLQTETTHIVSKAFVGAVFAGILGWAGWKLWIAFWRWARDMFLWGYGRTKKVRFMALQDRVADVLWLPWPMREGVLYKSDMEETRLLDPPSRRKVMMLEAELRQLGIPVPQIDYTRNYHDYFREVFSYVVQGNRRGCIAMSQTYKEPKTPEEEAFDKMRQGGPEAMSNVSPHLQVQRYKEPFVG